MPDNFFWLLSIIGLTINCFHCMYIVIHQFKSNFAPSPWNTIHLSMKKQVFPPHLPHKGHLQSDIWTEEKVFNNFSWKIIPHKCLYESMFLSKIVEVYQLLRCVLKYTCLSKDFSCKNLHNIDGLNCLPTWSIEPLWKAGIKWWQTFHQKVLQNEEGESKPASISIHLGLLDWTGPGRD